ncbi:MAG: rhodanese-like domain-containing protein [Alphaproteobacteria bacterium]|nr:rhodanese-like domain-containing protein [Alphaproteobacteria bacterium]
MTQVGVISAEGFSTLMSEKPDLNILDIRTDLEYKNMALDYPVNHQPLHTIKPDEFTKTDTETFILCKAGPRAFKLAEILAMQGHENLIVIDGGITGLQACGAHLKLSETPVPMEAIMQAVQSSFQKFMVDNS